MLGDVFERLQHVAALVALFERERVDNAQLALFLLLLPYALDREDKFVILKGLEQIVVRVELERGAGVLKVAVRREYDGVRAAAAAAQLAQHLYAVQLRHTYVGYDEIGAVPLGGEQTFLAVCRLADHDAAHRRPIDAEGDAAADDGLVVNDQNLQHCRFPPWSSAGEAPRGFPRRQPNMRCCRSRRRNTAAQCGQHS